MTQALPAEQSSHPILSVVRPLLRPAIAGLLTVIILLSPLNDLYPLKIRSSLPWIGHSCLPLSERPLRVGITHWAGFAGGILANGGVKSGADSARRWETNGVELVYLDDVESRKQAFSGCADDGNHVDMLWTSIEAWAREYPQLQEQQNSLPYKLLPRAIMQVARSDNACTVMAPPDFEGHIEDLSFLKVGVPEWTPAHAIALRTVADHPEAIVLNDSPKKALEGFLEHHFYAVALCEPFLQRLSRVLLNSKRLDAPAQQSYILVARGEVIKYSSDVVQKLVQHWLEGNKHVRGSWSLVVKLLHKERDAELAGDRIDDLRVEMELKDAHISTAEDNEAMFATEYDAQFEKANQFWVKAHLAESANPKDSRADQFVRNIMPFARTEDCTKRGGAEGKLFEYTLHFATDSYEISDSAESWIATVSEILHQEPRAQVCITGHTDNTGSDNRNAILSLDRANEVARYLKVKPARVVTFGKADLEPTTPGSNETEQGRAGNRRAVIEIVLGAAK